MLVSVWLSGCTAVHPRIASGTGTYVWFAQRLDWLYPYPLEEVRQATVSALAVLQYDIQIQQFDGLGGELKARPLVGQLAQIHADPLSLRTPKVQVHVSGSGGRQEAERIHATIRSELGM